MKKGRALPERRKPRTVMMEPNFDAQGNMVSRTDVYTGTVEVLDKPISKAEMDKMRGDGDAKRDAELQQHKDQVEKKRAVEVRKARVKESTINALMFEGGIDADNVKRALDLLTEGEVQLSLGEVKAIHHVWTNRNFSPDDGVLTPQQQKSFDLIVSRATAPIRRRQDVQVWEGGRNMLEDLDKKWAAGERPPVEKEVPFVAPAYVPKRGDVRIFDGPENDDLLAQVDAKRESDEAAAKKPVPPKKGFFGRLFGRKEE